MEMDSVMAAAKPAASSTVLEPPPAITPRTMPRMLTSPSCPPRMTSRSQFVVRWCSRWREVLATAVAIVVRTVRPNRVSAPSLRSGSAFIAHLPSCSGNHKERALQRRQAIESGPPKRNDVPRDCIVTMRRPLEDAWRTIVPPAEDPHGPLSPLLLGLTVVTGLVDAFSYLVLGHVFVANMTGNVVFLGFALAGASGFSLAASLVALAAFGLGALAGGRVSKRLGMHRGHLLAVAAAVEACLVVASVGIAATVGDPGSGVARYLLIVLLGVATGTQNAAASKLAVPDLTTTVLTLTITGIFADGPLAGGAASKLGRRLTSIASMFLGGLVGAVLVLHADASLAIAAAAAILVVVAAAAALQSRTDRPLLGASQAP